MLVDIHNQEGGKTGQVRLPKEIFDVKVNPDLVHQVVVSQMANRRQGTAHTKNRGEVRGGGRKPWRQKGTGRARHGSIRSPLWKGGGVTFGPRTEKVYKKIIPKKMRKTALFMVLSGKLKNGLLVLLDSLKTEKPKTKQVFEILQKLPCKGKSALIILPDYDKNMILSARNISGAATIQAKDINALDLLLFKYLVLPKESVKVIEKTFMNEKLKMRNEK